MPDRSTHVLVTGGAGFIGSHLVERLLHDGKSVTVIDDCSTGRWENLRAVEKHPKLRIIEQKVSSCQELGALAGECSAIYHLAAAVGVELVMQSAINTIDTNLRETQAVLEAAAAQGTPLLLTSTSEVYGKSSKEGFSEEDDLLIGPPHLSRWSYACSKLMDEFLALAYARERQLPVVIARLFNTVGPRQTGQYGMVLPRFIAAAKRNNPLRVYGDGSQTRCFCYVTDAVEALIRLQNHPAALGQIFNVGSQEEISILALAQSIVEAMKSTSDIEIIPYSAVQNAGFQDMLRRKPIVDKLYRVTGFQPLTKLEQIIKLTACGE